MFHLLAKPGSRTSFLDCIPAMVRETGTPRVLPWGRSSMHSKHPRAPHGAAQQALIGSWAGLGLTPQSVRL